MLLKNKPTFLTHKFFITFFQNYHSSQITDFINNGLQIANVKTLELRVNTSQAS